MKEFLTLRLVQIEWKKGWERKFSACYSECYFNYMQKSFQVATKAMAHEICSLLNVLSKCHQAHFLAFRLIFRKQFFWSFFFLLAFSFPSSFSPTFYNVHFQLIMHFTYSTRLPSILSLLSLSLLSSFLAQPVVFLISLSLQPSFVFFPFFFLFFIRNANICSKYTN